MLRLVYIASYGVFCACAEAALPSVDTVLTKANSKALDFAQKAADLQKKLDEERRASRAALSKQKEEYEKLLQAQSHQSSVISQHIEETKTGNNELSKLNTQTMAEVTSLREKNAEMRSALESVISKVSAAQLFLADSLKVTDDSNAKELDVLIPSTPEPTLDHFLAMTRDNKMSLLAVHTRRASRPEDFVSMLAGSLEDIETAQKEGIADLKAHFMESFSQGEKHQAELNATLAALNQTQVDLKEKRAKLLEAKAHLESTNKDLNERLRAMRAFANRVDDTVRGSLLGEGEAKTTRNLLASANAVNASSANATPARKVAAFLAKPSKPASLKRNATVAKKLRRTKVPVVATKKTQVPVVATEKTQVPVVAKKIHGQEVAALRAQVPVVAAQKMPLMPVKAAATETELDTMIHAAEWVSRKLR